MDRRADPRHHLQSHLCRIGPFPPLVEDEAWVHAAAANIDRDGKEQFLVNPLSMLRQALDGVEFPTLGVADADERSRS